MASKEPDIFWDAVDTEEDERYEATVKTCALLNGNINITFSGIDHDSNCLFEGQLSIKAVPGDQTTKGLWRYPSKIRDEEEETKAIVTGCLKNFRGKKVVFEGEWDEHNKGKYKLEIDTELG